MDSFDLLDIKTPEFDYNFLLNLLSQYKSPRDKITKLIKKGEIIRVKKGIYVLGERYKSKASLEILANMIYGPSYISKEYALSYYGLIPERVHTVTSMTSKKSRSFDTPLEKFSFDYISKKAFHIGVRREMIDERRGFLIATKEKALCDRVLRERLATKSQVEEFILDGLRVELSDLRELNVNIIHNVVDAQSSESLKYLAQFLRGVM